MYLLSQNIYPCTAIITFIVYGPPGVRVFFKGGKAPEVVYLPEFQRRYRLSETDYVGKDRVSTDPFSTIDYAEVSYEIEMCRHGMQLVDLPGINVDVIRTKRTHNLLTNADAVVMVLDATTPVSHAETEFIEMLRGEFRQSNIFFAINKWNLLNEMMIDPTDYVKIEARFRQKLGGYCVLDGADLYDSRVYRIDAKLAVKSRTSTPPDADGLTRSEIPALEKGLEQFLTEERGGFRALSVLGEAQMTCDSVSKYIRIRRTNLEEHKQSFTFDADKERNHLDTLEHQVKAEMQKLETLCLRRPGVSAQSHYV